MKRGFPLAVEPELVEPTIQRRAGMTLVFEACCDKMTMCTCDFEEARGAIITACAEHGSWIVKDGKAERLDPAAMP